MEGDTEGDRDGDAWGYTKGDSEVGALNVEADVKVAAEGGVKVAAEGYLEVSVDDTV